MNELIAQYYLIAFVIGIVFLVKSADAFVENAAAIASHFGISKIIVGLTIVAMGTSAPEFAVSSLASVRGSGSLAVANVVGSNIFNLGFILAICALITPLAIERKTVFRDCFFLICGGILLLYFVANDGHVTRVEGGVLFVSLIGYLIFLFRTAASDIEETDLDPSKPLLMLFIFTIIGLVGLLLGCNMVVTSAQTFAAQMGVSEWMIGMTVVAVGTSLPELVTAVASVLKKDAGIGVGGLIGSDIFNIFGVIGMTSMLYPIDASALTTNLSPFYFLIGSTVLTTLLMARGWLLTRWKGGLIMLVAFLRYVYEFAK